MPKNIPRVVIAATHSGAGKSTITMGLLMTLQKKGLDPQSFKTGPDYLDPMHHTMVLGKECRNLDTWMFGSEAERLFVNGSEGSGISVIEGVMGLYDGVDGINEEGSTAHLSKILKAPVILVIDARSMARSAGAIAAGFKDYDKDVFLAGVIFNRVGSANHMRILESSLKGIPCLGGVFRDDCMKLESRHLGLIPAAENYDREKYEKIAEHVEKCVDIEKILNIARSAPPISREYRQTTPPKKKVRIGVAKDKAFNFYYIHNIESLEEAGAEIVPFSPIDDDLPDVDGLYFGGGFPELFSADLERNSSMMAAVKKASDDGMPIYAECGGMMYLSESLIDLDGKEHKMCGVFDSVSNMTDSRATLGYVEMTAAEDNMLCEKGWSVRGHEFHYSKTSAKQEKYAFRLSRGFGIENGRDGMVVGNTVAGYTHIHFASNPKIPGRFVGNCYKYAKN
ncbi:cobyrinic acid A,C-diamide synthase [Candidatus Methanoplasma termitum]|uniref:Cobyrinate a,c-diamide synthase n=1 Tax=Candidatus Methanoplasma termitum TaxID=1577791 RepID=A0A0A7LDJ6_9ARCH|nr:cobyrinate a,c-diamide synthase [Candidatus Methanoplasma termitum]AIZ56402.1 cobyrinic acid A,C-diamide synthase [Candidatus Methanoplasma termitum]MCL2333698.1 hydrogenobyrinic acid a,c-diamide synthase (glutamine-hydrolyzing) [Candidatus Methanoplasma sp.]